MTENTTYIPEGFNTIEEFNAWCDRMQAIKKDFQKVIRTLKKEWQSGSYPKPMMTGAQMERDTATVNCSYMSDRSKELAEKVINDERFIQFLNKHNITAEVETIMHNGMHETYPINQVRLHY